MGKPAFASSFETHLRQKRFELLGGLLEPLRRPIRILDVGGTMGFWEVMDYARLGGIEVTLLNVYAQGNLPPSFRSQIGDARSLNGCKPEDYDVVVSNSVIGHVGSFENQQKMAGEIQRIATRYFVQTPNHFFPIDWRTLLPFFHFLPVKQKAWWLHHFPLAPFGRIKSFEDSVKWAGAVRNLTCRELKCLFPGARIARERLLGLTKSFMVFKGFHS